MPSQDGEETDVAADIHDCLNSLGHEAELIGIVLEQVFQLPLLALKLPRREGQRNACVMDSQRLQRFACPQWKDPERPPAGPVQNALQNGGQGALSE